MAKKICISRDAHERLKSLRCEGETFSEVVLRLAEERSLSELAGALSNKRADSVEEAIEERRERRRGELEAVADRMRET